MIAPVPEHLNADRLPDAFLDAIRDVPQGEEEAGPYISILAARYRHDCEKNLGLPTSDAWIVAGIVAGCLHVHYTAGIAARASEDNDAPISEREAFVVSEIAMASASAFVEALRQIGAIPDPEED